MIHPPVILRHHGAQQDRQRGLPGLCSAEPHRNSPFQGKRKFMNMQSNHMKTRTVAAILVGGSLAVTSSASAGLTWMGSASDPAMDSVIQLSAFSPAKSDFVQLVGADALTAGTATMGASTISYSGIDAQGGWALSGSLPNVEGSYVGSNNNTLFFEVTGQQQVSFSSAAGLGSMQFRIMNWNTFETLVDHYDFELDNPAAFDWTETLEAGVYVMQFNAASRSEGDIAFSGDMMTFTVPAPGALALVGAAGLVGARRRR